MSDYLVAGIIAASILITTGIGLHDIAQSGANTAIEQAESMQLALPCAYAGVPLEECSSRLEPGALDEAQKKTIEDAYKYQQELIAIQDALSNQ